MKTRWMGLAAAALLCGGSAFAQGYNNGYGNGGYNNNAPPPPNYAQSAPMGEGVANDMGMENRLHVTAGAGLADFTGSLGDHTNTGLAWDVRGAYDFTRHLGMEVSYLGAHNGIDDQRLPTGHAITTTGLFGDLKLSAPVQTGSGVLIKPYLFGGVGGAYYGVSGDTSLYESDSDLVIPIGLGGDAYLTKNLSVGARLGYDFNIANRIGDQSAGNLMNLTANLGVHY